MIEVPPGSIAVGESDEEMGSLALAACQMALPLDSAEWTVGKFGHEIIWSLLCIPGYVEQARRPRLEVIGGALLDISNAATLLANAVALEFDDGPKVQSADVAMRRKIRDRIRNELLGIQRQDGSLLNFREEFVVGSDGETRYFNHPPHDFLRDLEPRIRLLQRAVDSTYELHAAATEISRRTRATRGGVAKRRKGRAIGNRVLRALIVDLAELWEKVFGEAPGYTLLSQGRQDGVLSKGKRFPALVRFACDRSGIVVRTANALHVEIRSSLEEYRKRIADA